MQKSSVDSQSGAIEDCEDEDSRDENRAGEDGFSVTIMARLRWNPPHTLLARREAGACSDREVFI